MPGLNIKTSLFPYRLKLRTREPLELTFSVTNTGVKPKLISFVLQLPPQLGLDKSGLNRVARKRVAEKLMQGATRKFAYEIFPSKVVETGEYTAVLEVSEHFDNYNYVLDNKTEEITIKVEE